MEKLNEDYVVCMECERKFKQVTASHLLKAHSITMEEYKLKHNNPIVTSSNMNKGKGIKISEIRKSRNIPAWNKGIPTTSEQKEKQSITMKEKFSKGEITHWNVGNHWSDEHREKLSEANIGKTQTQEAKVKQAEAHAKLLESGWVSPLRGRKLSEEHKSNALEGLKRVNEKKKYENYQNIVIKCTENELKVISHEDYYYYNLICLKCDTEFSRTRQVFTESKNNGKKLCPNCFPPAFVSKGETEFIDYVESIYSGTVIRNDRRMLNGKEIDCYLPELNIGFEYNGLYWHSEIYHEKGHLLDKVILAKSKNIKLINVFDDEWLTHNDIVKSRIASIIGNISNKVYARKTIIKEISAKESNSFLNENHLQGGDKSPIRYGLFYLGELLSVMTFNKGGFVKSKDGSYELCRFAIKRNYTIVGGASKLFTHFLRDVMPEKVVTYADSRWSTGDIYKTLGFTLSHASPPCPWYSFDFSKRENRAKFMRHKLNVEDGISTASAIRDLGYYKIYDCGNTVWVYESPVSFT